MPRVSYPESPVCCSNQDDPATELRLERAYSLPAGCRQWDSVLPFHRLLCHLSQFSVMARVTSTTRSPTGTSTQNQRSCLGSRARRAGSGRAQYRFATVKMSRANQHDTSTMQLQDKKIRGFLTILLRKSSLQRLPTVRAQLHTSTFRKLAFTEALQRSF